MDGDWRGWHYLVVLGRGGLFCKESAVVLVGATALFELTWWRERRQGRALLLACIALLAPLGAMLYQRAAVLSSVAEGRFSLTDNPILGAGFWAGKLTAAKVLARYLWLTVWPLHLSADYSYSQIRMASGTVGDWLAWIAVAAAAAGMVLLYRVHRTAFFLACFAFLTLASQLESAFPHRLHHGGTVPVSAVGGAGGVHRHRCLCFGRARRKSRGWRPLSCW